MSTTDTPTPAPIRQATEQDGRDLEQVRILTRKMREHEREIVEIGKRRRHIMRALRDRGVSFPRIADATGTTTQSVYKDLRWGK